MRLTLRPLISSAALIAVCALLGACSDDDSSAASSTESARETTTSSPTASPTTGGTTGSTDNAALCAERDKLQSSIQNLTSVDVVRNGTSSLQAAVADVRTNVQSLRATAKDQFQDQTQALENSLQQLETALQDTSSSGVAGVVTAAGAALQSGSALLSSLQSIDCG